MKPPKIDTKLLALAIARAKGTKPETYLRKMHTLKHSKTGRVMQRKSRYALPYPQYAIRNKSVYTLYMQMVRK